MIDPFEPQDPVTAKSSVMNVKKAEPPKTLPVLCLPTISEFFKRIETETKHAIQPQTTQPTLDFEPFSVNILRCNSKQPRQNIQAMDFFKDVLNYVQSNEPESLLKLLEG